MRGRKPKPTAVRVLEGHAGHRSLPVGEPQPEVVEAADRLPRPPKPLQGVARKMWRRQVAILSATRVLTVSDLETLEHVCAVCGELADLRARLAALLAKPEVDQDEGLYFRLHGAINQKQAIAEKVMADFGMNPSARTRIKTEHSPGIKDKLRAFQKERRVAAG